MAGLAGQLLLHLRHIQQHAQLDQPRELADERNMLLVSVVSGDRSMNEMTVMRVGTCGISFQQKVEKQVHLGH